MADATYGERQEAIPKDKEFMPCVSTEQLANAFRAERVGKSKSILESCVLRRDSMGIRAIAKLIRVPYSTVRGWLERMKDGDLERRFDKKHPGQKRQLDERLVHAIRRWLGDPPPNLYGFRAGTWSLDMLVQSVRWRFGTTYKERTMRRTQHSGLLVPQTQAGTGKVGHSRGAERVHGLDQQAGGGPDGAGLCHTVQGRGSVPEVIQRRVSVAGQGGYDTVDVSFSMETVKMFGALGRKGHHIRVVDVLNSDTFIDFLKMLQKTYPSLSMY